MSTFENKLDEDFGNYHQLKIDAQHSEVLHVRKDQWRKEVLKMERNANVGCAMVPIFLPIMIWGLVEAGLGELIFVILLLALFMKIRNAKRGNNLHIHGAYEYELSLQKIVRYSSHGYDIFYYKDIQQFQEKPFGLILRKKIRWIDRLGLDVYKYTNASALILPNQLFAYEQSRDFIVQRINDENQ